MGVSIYNSARRPYALSETERRTIEEVVKRFAVADQIEEYLQIGTGWREDFCLYEPPFDLPDTILEGATKLPIESDDEAVFAVRHWCKALSELRRMIPDAEWQVRIDDAEIHWDEAKQQFDPFK